MIELWLLIEVGGAIGGLSCVLLVIATAVIGGLMVRKQGFDVVQKMHLRMSAGEPVVAEMVDAVALLFAGLLLLFPGLLTDGVGFLLLVPMLRKYVKDTIIVSSRWQGHEAEFSYHHTPSRDEKVIDVDTTKP